MAGGETHTEVLLVRAINDSLVVRKNEREVALPVRSISFIYRRFGEGNVSTGLLTGITLGATAGVVVREVLEEQGTGQSDQTILIPMVGAALGGLIGTLAGESSAIQMYDLHRINEDRRQFALRMLIVESGGPAELWDDDTQRIARESLHRAEVPSGGPNVFYLSAGGVLPLGEFASTSGEEAGSAKTGIGVSGELRIPISAAMSWSLGSVFAFNSINTGSVEAAGTGVTAGSWFLMWPMLGFQYQSNLSSELSWYGAARCGAVIGSTPTITSIGVSTTATVLSTSAGAVAYGVGAGLVLDNSLFLGVEYLRGKPTYEITTQQGTSTTRKDVTKPASIMLITLGVLI